jgi:hypothetical protein
MAQAQLVRARITHLDILPFQDFGATEFVDADCLNHQKIPSRKTFKDYSACSQLGA